MKIALIQADIRIGDPDANMIHLLEMMTEAVRGSRKPDVLVLPEMWNTGYALDRIHELADPDGQRTRKFLSDFAGEYGVHLVGGSVAEKKDGGIYNTMYVFNREGKQTAEYSKIHLFRLMEEEKYLQAGGKTVTFPLEGGFTAGAVICYDIRFPELPRRLVLDGANVMFVPAQWPHPRLEHWLTLLKARAIENQMYVAACNRVGESGGDRFCGHSVIIDPWGEVTASGGEEEGIITGPLDPALPGHVRSRIPVFEDRKPSVY